LGLDVAQVEPRLKQVRLLLMDSELEARPMIDDLDNLNPWDAVFERRSCGRTRIHRSALLFFHEKSGVRPCTVRDVTNLGARIAVQDLTIAPLDFLLSFDHFRTARTCRMIWRHGDLLGVAFKS
jgi:hypothetical protein